MLSALFRTCEYDPQAELDGLVVVEEEPTASLEDLIEVLRHVGWPEEELEARARACMGPGPGEDEVDLGSLDHEPTV